MDPGRALVGTLVLGLVLGACDREEGAGMARQQKAGTITVAGKTANDHGSKEVSEESSIDFELDDFYFEPTILQGKAGQMITLEAFNER